MIKTITVTNYLGESLEMELSKPELSGIAIMSVSGLGPVKASIGATELSISDGAIFNSARISSRNIVFKCKLLSLPTIEDTRLKTYKYFPIKKPITITVVTDSRECSIVGYVESNEPSIFDSFETTTISVICPDPYFYSSGISGVTVTVFSGVNSGLEFDFSNESLTDNLLNMGDIVSDTTKTIVYEGDSEVGMIIQMHITGDVSSITVYNVMTREYMTIDADKLELLTGEKFVIGDDVIISTVQGDKYIYLKRNGEYINILNCLNKYANWFQLSKGDNVFAYAATIGTTNIEFKITNKTLYEGV